MLKFPNQMYKNVLNCGIYTLYFICCKSKYNKLHAFLSKQNMTILLFSYNNLNNLRVTISAFKMYILGSGIWKPKQY